MMRVGDKVVCIRTNIYNDDRGTHIGAVKGRCYTIYAIVQCRCGNVGLDIGIPKTGSGLLSKCNRCLQQIRYDQSWLHAADRFRPIEFINCTDELAKEATIKRKDQDLIPDKIKEHESEV